MGFVHHPRTVITFSRWARILFAGSLGLGLAACSNSTPLEAVASKTCLTGDTTPVETGQAMRINVLSNRADLISGGDALVEIVLPQGAKADSLAVDVGGRNVGDRFGLTENGRRLGVITGLPLGNSVLTARLPLGGGISYWTADISSPPNGRGLRGGPGNTEPQRDGCIAILTSGHPC